MYITLTGLIDSMVPMSGLWAVLGKILSYIVKLAPILWWALPAGPVGCLPTSSQEPPPTPKPTISTPPTSDATGQSSQFLGVLYLALTWLIDSAFPAAGPWAVAEKALSYLLKLGPIIWWAMPVPALTPPSLAGAPQYSWYPDMCTLKKNDVVPWIDSGGFTHEIHFFQFESQK
ncbi:hypothetical protein DSO57_1032293 [Entomophthora muscae]|uniref:Uncharacterized protein n=1 Tax=Entomophthora muscae TaxID=34485 RepID=A0ACC2U9X9_9FUNG|nr:hypothetical protein DSO57_1032293 [Entomophthora muscae]